MIGDWRSAMEEKLKRESRTGQGGKEDVHRWYSPKEWAFKVNVDASVVKGLDTFTMGMVLHDHKGMFMEGKNLRMPCPESVFAAMGVREALSWFVE